MRIVVIGSNNLIGSRLVPMLREAGHETVAASPESGVEVVTGDGLADVLRAAAVVVDLSDPPACEHAAAAGAMGRFTMATRALLEYETAAGVTHHVALSSVGTEDLLESSYFRARCAQEQLIKASPVPYSIVRAALLFESVKTLADAASEGAAVHVPPVMVQPVAADDVARQIAAIAVAPPLNGTIEVGGPEPFYLDGLVRRVLGATNDPRAREVIGDTHARYFGARPVERSLVAGDEAELGEFRFDDWLRDTPPASRNGHIWTGAVLRGPAKDPLKTYRVIIDGDIGRVAAD